MLFMQSAVKISDLKNDTNNFGGRDIHGGCKDSEENSVVGEG